MTPFDYLASARRTISIESEAVTQCLLQLDDQFSRACELILSAQGRVIVTGMGKSGHIGRKIAATLASTGTPAFFVHPGEASHGDLGMITHSDVVVALSNSGESAEIVTIIPSIKRVGARLIAMTGNIESFLAKSGDALLNCSVPQEACSLNLAPTSSTTVQLVMGDALAIALMEAKGFSAEDFAFSHPGGSLGKRLLLTVGSIMHTGEALPIVADTTPLRDVLVTMTEKKLGLAIVVGQDHTFTGVFTDGDLRRVLDQPENPLTRPIKDIIKGGGTAISDTQLAAEALYIMEQKKITNLIILNDDKTPRGVIHLHDLLQAGIA
jgi:arabinose-5-phosphate isomerase